MKEATDNQERKETKKMTKYYLRIARYFLSTAVLTGFAIDLKALN
jgi:hypothetical protein